MKNWDVVIAFFRMEEIVYNGPLRASELLSLCRNVQADESNENTVSCMNSLVKWINEKKKFHKENFHFVK